MRYESLSNLDLVDPRTTIGRWPDPKHVSRWLGEYGAGSSLCCFRYAIDFGYTDLTLGRPTSWNDSEYAQRDLSNGCENI